MESPRKATVPAARRACHVVALGDSLTDHRSGGGGYLRILGQRCPGSTFENWGKGGDMVNQMRRRFESALRSDPSARYTHFIVWGGVNDLYSDETAGRSPAKIERDLAAIYAEARGRGARVVAVTVAPWGGFTRWYSEKRGRATLELNDWIRREGDVVVDAYSLLSCGEAERLCPEYEPPFKDGLHFGKGGHERLGAALYEAEFQSCL